MSFRILKHNPSLDLHFSAALLFAAYHLYLHFPQHHHSEKNHSIFISRYLCVRYRVVGVDMKTEN